MWTGAIDKISLRIGFLGIGHGYLCRHAGAELAASLDLPIQTVSEMLDGDRAFVVCTLEFVV